MDEAVGRLSQIFGEAVTVRIRLMVDRDGVALGVVQ
jgi:hypothetical protein